MRYLLATTILAGLTTGAYAENPFYLGVAGGFGLAATTNPVLQNGVMVGEFPITGTTVGTLAGLVAGYQQQVRWIYWGAEVSASYDFSRLCFGIDCAAERRPGLLAQGIGELGVAWNSMVFAARLGAAGRTNNLCAFDLPALTRDCGSGLVLGPDFGGKLKFKVAPHADIAITWDHIAWKGLTASTPVSAVFQNSVSISHEEVFKLSITFH